MYQNVTRFGTLLTRICLALLLFGAATLSQAQAIAKMALLLPDGLALTGTQVTAWTHAAQEQGYTLDILRNAAFEQAGPGIRAQYSGIIVPDQMQVSMTDALVSAIKTYVFQGGNVMLVYDAGALTATGFYAAGKSRFSELVGVDYVLYDTLLDRTTGLGPVVGPVSNLRNLLVPPGKSMLYTAPVAIAARSTASFLPVSPSDPGGLKGYDPSRHFASEPGVTEASASRGKKLKPEGKVHKHPGAIERAAVPSATSASTALRTLGAAAAAVTEPVHSISGYVYGALTYPSFVTQGVSSASVLLSSPDHGVVASTRSVASGSVLFVNLPLTYLKLYEDAMPMHGFVHLFASNVLKQPRLTSVPDGIGGLVFNWHLDSGEALAPMQTLKNMGVWNYKPFSIHITAGPDTIAPGDRLGFDLPNNAAARQFLRDFDAQGHQVASHGGWIHDYYGLNANETNEAGFLNYLVLNRDAVTNTLGHASTEYSAPQGNNPLWSLNWLQQNGIGSYYSLSHTGTGVTRGYRGGNLVYPSMWAVPVTPFGVAATFEEFTELGFAEADIIQWYKDLMDFASNNESNRMIYAHPPGAVDFPNVMNTMLQYANTKQRAGKFRWYTMTRLRTFMVQRAATTWQGALASNGRMRVTASNATNLNNLTWAYPKSQYARPVVVTGNITVIDQGIDWLVRVNSGRNATFEAAPL